MSTVPIMLVVGLQLLMCWWFALTVTDELDAIKQSLRTLQRGGKGDRYSIWTVEDRVTRILQWIQALSAEHKITPPFPPYPSCAACCEEKSDRAQADEVESKSEAEWTLCETAIAP